MEHNGKYMMANNYQYTLDLFDWCQDHGVPLLYASSAAVYGAGRVFSESREHEAPLNVYGYSKFLFDQRCAAALTSAARKWWAFVTSTSTARANNTKAAWPSVAFHHFNQYLQTGKVKLFEGWMTATPTAARCATLFRWKMVKVNLHFWTTRKALASSIWAAAAPNRLTTSPSLPSTPAAEHQGQAAPSLAELVEQGAGIHRLPGRAER